MFRGAGRVVRIPRQPGRSLNPAPKTADSQQDEGRVRRRQRDAQAPYHCNPERGGRCRDRAPREPAGPDGEGAGLPPGQGPGARRLAALQGRDPARRGPRPGAAGARQRPAGARPRARRHARRPRRGGGTGRAADVRGHRRHGAAVRSGRVSRRGAAQAGRHGRGRGRGRDAGAAPPAGGAIRAGRGPAARGARLGDGGSRAAGDRRRAAGRAREARERHDRPGRARPTRPGSPSSWWASKPARTRCSRCTTPTSTR